jgi:hypothetical protein
MRAYSMIFGLFLGLMFLASPVFAQSNIQPLNNEGIAKAMGKTLLEKCIRSLSQGRI